MSARRDLDALVREAKSSFVPEESRAPRDELEAKLLAQLDDEDRAAKIVALDRRSPRRARTIALTASALAIAAAAVLFVGRGDRVKNATFDAAASNGVENARSSSIVQRRGTGKIVIAGVVAESGAGVFVGDPIETQGTTAFFERAGAAEGAVAVRWSMEDSTRLRITQGIEGGREDAALILSLEKGAVEAQVTPVDHGEAFAVDVEGARVAVHGTHLRVARETRDGVTKVIVDLSEGVISVGPAPRVGSTYGAFVTAPAHVEFDAADVNGTMRVNHAPSSVRAAVTMPTVSLHAPRVDRDSPEAREAEDRGAIARPVTRPVSAAPRASAASANVPLTASKPSNSDALTMSAIDPNAEDTVAAAVRACAVAGTRSATHDGALGSVTVTMNTTLEVQTSDLGLVTAAHFTPPLAPDVQTCAADAIYRTRFARGDTFRISIEVVK